MSRKPKCSLACVVTDTAFGDLVFIDCNIYYGQEFVKENALQMPHNKNNHGGSESVGRICPFCALLCEDAVGGNLAKLPCAVARKGYQRGAAVAAPMVRGEECSIERACREAGALLRLARRPLLAGLDTDVAGVRAAVGLAQRCNGVLDHMHGDAMASYAALMREARWFSATLAELRQRADLLLCIGCDFDKTQPLLLQRLMKSGRKKKLMLLASGNVPAAARAGASSVLRPASAPSQVPEAIDMMLLGLKSGSGGKRDATWGRHVAALRQAEYVGVICKVSGSVTARLAQMRAVMGLVELLNEKGRAAIYSVTDGEGAMTAMQVGLWLTGFPLRVAYDNGTMRHDPVRYASANLLRNREVDAMLWISATAGAPPPAHPGVPAIALSRADRPPADGVEVHIPVATPGLGGSGVLFRGDSTVSLPLKAHHRPLGQELEVSQALGMLASQLEPS